MNALRKILVGRRPSPDLWEGMGYYPIALAQCLLVEAMYEKCTCRPADYPLMTMALANKFKVPNVIHNQMDQPPNQRHATKRAHLLLWINIGILIKCVNSNK